MDGKLKMPQTGTYIPICRGIDDETPRRPRRPGRVILACALIFGCAVALYRPETLGTVADRILALRPTLATLGTRTREAVEAFAGWDERVEAVWSPAEPAVTTTAATTAMPAIAYPVESPAPVFAVTTAAATTAATTAPEPTILSSDPAVTADWPEIVTASVTAPDFDYTLPVSGRVSSAFGYRDHPVDGENKFHYGVDIAASEGTPIAAFADGTVIYAGVGEINGNYLKIRHADGYVSLYAHLSQIDVEWGESVKKGQTIGKVGQTGKVTGPHLHLQLYQEGQLFDPTLLLGDALGV